MKTNVVIWDDEEVKPQPHRDAGMGRCPFCGARDLVVLGGDGLARVSCRECQAQGPTVRMLTPATLVCDVVWAAKMYAEAADRALEVWNRRTLAGAGEAK